MSEAAGHLTKARETIGFARYALAGGYINEAGRSAYMAAYHAALALITARTQRSPKTHSGVRSEFARLAQAERRINRGQVSLLGWAYELKSAADYGQEPVASPEHAERAINEAAHMIETIAELISPVPDA